MGRQRELLRLSIILCMGLLFVMAGILLIVGKPAVKRPSSIAGGVLMIAWGASLRHPRITVVDARTRHRPGNGRNRHNGGRPSMTSIDGLFAILEDRGLMPAVALFSLLAVLGLLYLSSGNLKAPTPTSDRTWMPGIPCAVTWPVFRCQSCGFVEKGHSREGK